MAGVSRQQTGIFLCSILYIIYLTSIVKAEYGGCAIGGSEGLLSHRKLSVCSGTWQGHIKKAENLCAIGWSVCSHEDANILKTIGWDEAMKIDGCFAFNAAQDGGGCKPCESNLEQDDLGAIGRSCPHQNQGQTSCIGSGRIDASCCVDTYFRRSCSFRPGITGVLCCKKPEKEPEIDTKLPPEMKILSGFNMTLTCHASGLPEPNLRWFRNGKIIHKEDKRLKLDKGALTLSKIEEQDTGSYSCVADNLSGFDRKDTFITVVKNVPDEEMGCHDKSVEGLNHLPGIVACHGAWKGHVKHGKVLCAQGWSVCNHNDQKYLNLISWEDANSMNGCYAYNAANNFGRCRKCSGKNHEDNMGGIGRHCSQRRPNKSSCLAGGRIDVFYGHKKRGGPSCSYKPGLVSGVLCCKIEKAKEEKPTCSPGCENGGECMEGNRCKCTEGFKGARCQLSTCKRPCENGGRCDGGKCMCPANTRGRFCQRITEPRHSKKQKNKKKTH
ncbi:neurogenic locus notch homolog protein 1-like isoform X2 [Anneissia japonica]|uniref:neurogenic locus notch homolog protein 1-like isoform X2 n=1 Tax=Anneissia japonica TaxID=1529436 RepID=UPI0014258921|nr:neurogenic locus notch homolog protein 1-like isoform X2 [Anneissia japonica]